MTKKKFDIAFYECFEEEERSIKALMSPNLKLYFSNKTIQENSSKQLLAPIISIRTVSEMPEEWSKDIKAILTRSTGFNNIVEYRNQTGGQFHGGNLPHYCTSAVAEHAVLLMMSLMRRLPEQSIAFEHFSRENLTGSELAKKNLVVIGIGDIGHQILNTGKALNMNCTGVDLNQSYKDVVYRPLDTAVANADVIVCALPLNDSTKNLLTLDVWKKTRKECVFINISRGEISPFTDLKKALELKYIRAVGMDAFNEESNIANYLHGLQYEKTPELEAFLELKKDPRVLFTPHNSFNTHEAVKRKIEQTIQQLEHYLDKKTFVWEC